MIKRNVDEMTGTPVTGDGISGVTMKLLVGREDEATSFAMRHFKVEPNGFTPKHSHDWEHEILVLKGQGELECDGETTTIAKGDARARTGNSLPFVACAHSQAAREIPAD